MTSRPRFGTRIKTPLIFSFVVAACVAETVSAQVGTPALVSPVQVINDTQPTYSWSAVSGGTEYYLWINGPSGATLFTQWYTAPSVCAGSLCSLRPNVVLAQGAHRWWVQAKSGSAVGPWSLATDFRVSSVSDPPVAPTLDAPEGTASNATPRYSWNAVSTASDYQLWVDGPSGNVLQQWYTAASVCSGSSCSVTPNVTLAAGTHIWWVRARNGAGDGPWSASKQFVVTFTAPAAPTLVSPSGTIGGTLPNYSWNAVVGAAEYQLWVDGPSGNVIKQWYSATVCPGATCSVTASVSLAEGSHTWWVQARNGIGPGPWSAPMRFTVAVGLTVPGMPTLVSPTGAISGLTPSYTWNAVATAAEYQLWVNGPSGDVISQWFGAGSVCSAATCSVRPNVTLAEGAHTWWVQARNGVGVGPWSLPKQFSATAVVIMPVAPSLVAPSGSIDDATPTYGWNVVSTATDYYLWVDGPSGNVIKQWFGASSVCSGATCSVTPSLVLAAGMHTWWVQAKNGAGDGPWSAPKPFTVTSGVPKPAAPTLVSPSGTISDVMPTYRWNAVSTATDYHLWVDGPSGNLIKQWNSAASVCLGGSCSLTPNVVLAAGSHLFWVQARNAAGDGPWSSALTFQASPGPSERIYVDGGLVAACASGDYSISQRGCTGTDGNAYPSIAAGFAALTSGKTLEIRSGTYVENNSRVPALGAYGSMTTVSAFPGELVVWENDDIYFDTLSLAGNANNITVRGIDFRGKRYIASNERQWVQWQGNVWRTTDATRPMGEVTEVKSGCSAATVICAKEVRSYLGEEKTSPAHLLSTGSDGDFFQDHTTDRLLYVYSASGNPTQRADIWETGLGITIGNNSSGTGLVAVEQCAFDGQGHVHLKGGYRWKVSRNAFFRVGTDFNDHHIYAWSNLSEGNEAIYEHNTFETDAGTGAALHVYGTGNQVANQPPDYHIFRYNLVRGGGFWGVLLDASHSKVTNNSFSLEDRGDRAINLQNFDASFNVISNNIISRPTLIPIIFEGSSGNRPSGNMVEFNLTDAGSLTMGTCSGCTLSGNLTGTSPGWVVAQPSSWIDFRLAPGSAAIDGGLNLGSPDDVGLDPEDIVWPPSTVDQDLHGSAWEIGAFVRR